MKRRKLPTALGAAIFLTLLLSYAVLTAAAQGMEVEKIGIRVTNIINNHIEVMSSFKVTCPEIKTQNSLHIASGVDTIVATSGQKVQQNRIDGLLTPGAISEKSYQHLVATGRAVLRGDFTYPMSDEYREAAIIAYEGERWDCWIHLRGYTNSPYYGRGVEIAKYLHARGRAVENCLATLEVESTFGVASTCHFGILYGNYPNTVEGYCDLLDDYEVSNDPWEQSCFWNMPGYPRYQNGFCRVVETIEGFWP